MTNTSPTRTLQLRTTQASKSRRQRLLDFTDDQIFAKVSSVGLRAALAILLSIFGLGAAMGQSVDQDMAHGANTQAARDRVIAEIRQARADGAIKRWSPVLVDIPSKAPLKGRRFEPYATRQADVVHLQFNRDDGTTSSAVPSVTQRSTQ